MLFEKGKYYHLYNRSNNSEPVFRDDQNYLFFLTKFKKHIKPFCTVISYCLMPTHFHFLIRSETDLSENLSNGIKVTLRSYTRAINLRYNRHGNLFQQNTKTKLVDDETYLLTLVSYIHQNPLRAKLVENIRDWKYSSYLDLNGKRNGSLPDKNFLKQYFKTSADFERYSQEMVGSIKKEYWM